MTTWFIFWIGSTRAEDYVVTILYAACLAALACAALATI
jgi:hypothetical protein